MPLGNFLGMRQQYPDYNQNQQPEDVLGKLTYDYLSSIDVNKDRKRRNGGLDPRYQKDEVNAWLARKKQGQLTKEQENVLGILNPKIRTMLSAQTIDPSIQQQQQVKELTEQFAAPIPIPRLGAGTKELRDPKGLFNALIASGDYQQASRFADAYNKLNPQQPVDIQAMIESIKQSGGQPTLTMDTTGKVGLSYDPTKRQPEDEPITPSQLSSFVNNQGEPPPPGTTLRQAREGGYIPVAVNKQNLQASAQGANAVLDRLNELSNRIFTAGPGVTDRLLLAGQRGWEYASQSNPDVALFESLKRGTLAPIIRSMGEKGTLAEGDVKRAIDLLPKMFPVPDSREVALTKLSQIRNILSEATGAKPVGKKIQPRSVPNVITDEDIMNELRKRGYAR